MIRSLSNDLIKLVRTLHHKKGRLRENLFLAEGIHLVQEGLKSGFKIRHFFWTEKLTKTSEGRELLEVLKDGHQGFEVSEAVLAKISETENPQGVIATVAIPEQTTLAEFTDFKLGLIIDGLQDPGNVGAIIRTAWAFDCDGLFFTPGAADPYQGKVVRASMGGIFYQRICQNLEPQAIYQWSSRMGIRIIAGDPKATEFCFQSDLAGGSLILIGNEGRGLNPEWANYPINKTLIPQPGGAESLNASISAGILLYEALRQRLV
jgi:TrmH family RNA methyltransferase